MVVRELTLLVQITRYVHVNLDLLWVDFLGCPKRWLVCENLLETSVCSSGVQGRDCTGFGISVSRCSSFAGARATRNDIDMRELNLAIIYALLCVKFHIIFRLKSNESLMLILFRSYLSKWWWLVVLLHLAKHFSSWGVLLDLAQLIHDLWVWWKVVSLSVHACCRWSALVATAHNICSGRVIKVFHDYLSMRRTSLDASFSAIDASALLLWCSHILRCGSIRP